MLYCLKHAITSNGGRSKGFAFCSTLFVDFMHPAVLFYTYTTGVLSDWRRQCCKGGADRQHQNNGSMGPVASRGPQRVGL